MTYNIRGFRVIYAGFGGLRGGGGGQQQPATTTTIQKSDPWAGQQSYLKEIFKAAKAQYEDPAHDPKYYSGAVTAAQDPATIAAQNSLEAAAVPLQGLADNAVAASNFNLTNARDVNSNPYLQSAIQAAMRPVVQQYSDAGGTLSQIRDGTAAAGQWGGSTRTGIAEGLATSRLNQQLLDTASGMANEGYKSGLDAATKTLALTPNTVQTAQAPGTTLDAVGQSRTAYQQQLINDAIDKWNFEQNKDAAKLAQYQSMVQGNYGGTSNGLSTSSGGTSSGNGFMNTLGTGLSALGTIGKLFALF